MLVLALGSLFGRIGLGAGALLALLVGNPLSGLTSAPEMLPSGWAITVLACWVIVAAVLIVVAALRGGPKMIERGTGRP